ncbi:flagellar basal body P-ring formation chaperone FlgA [Salinimonas sediminis]|nr:flagellar basal body P-ring formation chaperone FlgA [Salinimonas sediminis]
MSTNEHENMYAISGAFYRPGSFLMLRKLFALLIACTLSTNVFAWQAASPTEKNGPDTTAKKDSSNHQVVQRGVQKYLESQFDAASSLTQITIEVADIDERIRIPDCAAGFAYYADEQALGQSYISVRVSCNNNQWYLFANAKVLRTQPVVVTASMISPGTVLGADNLSVAQVETNQLRHTAYHSVEALLGARMKHRVRRGQPIQANMLCFICKGDRITIRAQVGGMQVKTSGIAQQDGVIGETIKVTNSSSRKTVVAEVAGTDEVIVRL